MPKRAWEVDPAGDSSDDDDDDDDVPSLHGSDSGSDSGGDDDGHNIDGFGRGPSDDDEMDDDEQTSTDWGETFVDFCIKLLITRVLTARTFCSLMFFAFNAGISAANKYKLKPNSKSGHFNRKVRKSVGIYTDRGMYNVTLPGQTKGSTGRSNVTIPAFPAHELFEADANKNNRAAAKMQELIDDDDVPDGYLNHPVVVEHGGPVVPCAIFADGVPYSNSDSCIAFWLVNLLTARRYLFFILRKSQACRCGCRGWCTFHAIFRYIHWSISSLAAKLYPNRRHDGQPWDTTDMMASRDINAGEELTHRCCICFIKGDWCEYNSTFALPSWADGVRPCYKCNCVDINAPYIANQFSAGNVRENVPSDYDAAADRCEIQVELCQPLQRTLQAELFYDKRSHGNHGLCLRKRIVHGRYDLPVGARLEPSELLPDVGAIFGVLSLPLLVVFWLTSEETLVRHRTPLFDQRLGLSPASLTVDMLHCWYLGVFRNFAAACIWHFLEHGIWASASTMDEQVQNSLIVMMTNLRGFYKRRARAYPGENLTHIFAFTRKMVGTIGDKTCKSKGAETWGLLLFLVDQLETYNCPKKVLLLDAGKSLVRLVGLFSGLGWKVPQNTIRDAFEQWNRFLALLNSDPDLLADVDLPKKHITTHMLRELSLHGNPKWYACWLDEGLNRQLKGCCKHIHSANFEQCFLSGMRYLLNLAQSVLETS